MNDRWNCMSVVCTEPIEGLRAGSHYNVKGQGNLEFNAGTEKKGWGLCIEDDWVGCFDEEGSFIKDGWKIPYDKRTRLVYLTLEELERHFITDAENYAIYLRNQQLERLGI